MIFTQHYLGCLSHASYLIGDETTGRAVVVDPRRDVDVYLEEAAAKGLTIERVIETHIHADFLSGHLELAARTGAVISYGAGAEVEFPIEPLHDGQRLSLGEVTLEILATPGHTPESICDRRVRARRRRGPLRRADRRHAVRRRCRPSRPARVARRRAVRRRAGAAALPLAARQAAAVLPDSTRVFPAHGAGSSCGKKLSSETSSTLGEQRRPNYALQPMSEDAFVARRHRGPAERSRITSSSTRDATASCARCSTTEQPPPLDDRRGRCGAVPRARCCSTRASRRLRRRAPARRGQRRLQGRFAEWAADVLAARSGRRARRRSGDRRRSQGAARPGRLRPSRRAARRPGRRVRRPRRTCCETSSRLTIEQLAELRGLEPDLQLVDVRSPAETAAGTLAGCPRDPAGRAHRLAGGPRSGERRSSCTAPAATGRQVAASVLRGRRVRRRVRPPRRLRGLGRCRAADLDRRRIERDRGATPQVECATPRKALVDAGRCCSTCGSPTSGRPGTHRPRPCSCRWARSVAGRASCPATADRGRVSSGGRSAAVTESLRAWGFDAVNLAGGMCAWAAAGLPTVTGADDAGLVVHRTDR